MFTMFTKWHAKNKNWDTSFEIFKNDFTALFIIKREVKAESNHAQWWLSQDFSVKYLFKSKVDKLEMKKKVKDMVCDSKVVLF